MAAVPRPAPATHPRTPMTAGQGMRAVGGWPNAARDDAIGDNLNYGVRPLLAWRAFLVWLQGRGGDGGEGSADGGRGVGGGDVRGGADARALAPKREGGWTGLLLA